MYQALKRGALRNALLIVLGWACITAVSYPDVALLLGALWAPLMQGIGLTAYGIALGDLGMRVLQPRVDIQAMAENARATGSSGPGLVYLGNCILRGVVLLLVVTASRAEEPPAAAVPLLPVLREQIQTYWSDMPIQPAAGGQVEQETCPGLKHRSCWNVRAELKTSREQGVGLGQLTRAFRADGSTRFDAMAEIVAAFPKDLAGLSWENRYDATLQLRALVLKDLQIYRQIQGAATPRDRLAMTLVAYNGGVGGLNSDRTACRATPGCNPAVWFGHVERTSLKQKTKVQGYGQSFFCVNRTYPYNILYVRMGRYAQLGSDQLALDPVTSPAALGCTA